ncbi:MAG: metalloprotease PmbA [Gammaproteobacteria bacterium]
MTAPLTTPTHTTAPGATSAAGNMDELRAVAELALKIAAQKGASSAEAGVNASAGLSVSARMGDVETIEHTRDKALGVTVYFGHKKASASTSDFGAAAVEQTVEAACSIARYTAEDDCAGLADPELMAESPPDLDLCHPWSLRPERAIELALETEDAARSFDARITNSEGASVSQHEGMHVYGNTHGFLQGVRGTRHGISCSVIASDEDGMQRDYWYTSSRRAEDLEAAADVGRKSAERALARIGSRKLSTRQAPVLYVAEMAPTLVRHFIGAISGGNLYRRSSFLLDKLGERIFPETIRIHEQPHLKRAPGSAAFDGEGVTTRARDIVNAGRLEGYVLSSYSARKLQTQTTGNAGGVHNLTVESTPDALDYPALLAHMDTGLVVAEMMGMGVNITTGDYSRGAAGFWVENGEVQFPVHEITIAGNLADMLGHMSQVGTDVDERGNIRIGSILVDNMTIAGE